jgi:hypothetical protein
MTNPVERAIKSYRRSSKQSGQAIVLILLLTLAGLVGGVALFSTGILTSEKMQLQNAADASAYSVSVIEARDLNFTAYMNRAMVANEVGIGQMVSMYSWANMVRSTPEFISNYAGLVDFIIYPASLFTSCCSATNAVKAVTIPLRTVSTPVFKVVDKFTKPVAKGLTILNKMYSTAQQGFHLLNFIFSAQTLFDVKDENIDDAEFSPFGAVALARHFTSYYGNSLSSSLYGFVNGYSPGKQADAAGLNRLAQVVNDSRDGFTKNRKCDLDTTNGVKIPSIVIPRLSIGPIFFGPIRTTFDTPGVTCNSQILNSKPDGGWTATLFGVKIGFEAGFKLLGFETTVKAAFWFKTGIERLGGTDLRQNTDYNYTWSGVDTSAPLINVGGKIKTCVSAPIVGSTCGSAKIDFDLPTPPFGVGAAYASAKTTPNPAISVSGIPSGPAERDIMYGRTSKNLIAFNFPAVPIPNPTAGWIPTAAAWDHIKGVKQQLTEDDRQLAKSYKLHRYQDTADKPELLTKVNSDWISGLEAPFLLVALVKNNVVEDSQKSAGRFKFDPPENDILETVDIKTTVPFGVIAKSEVYYTRPSDLSYFKRPDDRVEKPNAFNPYWQARLVDTSYIDRVAALAFQHGQVPLPPQAFTIIEQARTLLAKIAP